MSQILDCINGGKKRRRGRMRLTLVTVSAIYAAMMFIIIGSAESLKGHELEECLAGLDSNFPPPRPLETSVDCIRSLPSFSRPTWWSAHPDEIEVQSAVQKHTRSGGGTESMIGLGCPPRDDLAAIGLAILGVPSLDTLGGAWFNACGVRIRGRGTVGVDGWRRGRNGGLDNGAEGVHLVMVLDAGNIERGLKTMDALHQVRGIHQSTLHLVLSRCDPSIADAGCRTGAFSKEEVEKLITFEACDVEVTVSVLSSQMLIGPLVKRSSFQANFWNGVQGWAAVRDLHALKHVLVSREQAYAVILEPGMEPAASFLKFHKAARPLSFRAASFAVLSSPPPTHFSSSRPHPHPCFPSLMSTLRPPLTPAANFPSGEPRGGSIGVTRRLLLSVYDSLYEGLAQAREADGGQAGGGFFDLVIWLGSRGLATGDFIVPSGSIEAEECGETRCRGDVVEEDEKQEEQGWRGGAWQDGAGVEEGEGLALQCAMQGWTVRRAPRRIFDCVNYFQEDVMLDLRMREIGSEVHRFIIVEGDKTFRGTPRTLHLPLHPPRGEHAHKVRLVVAELPSYSDITRDGCTEFGEGCPPSNEGMSGSWTRGYRSWFKREWMSRSAMSRGLYDMRPDDVAIIGDVDEIPRGSFLRLLANCDGVPLAASIESSWRIFNVSMRRSSEFGDRWWFMAPSVILGRALKTGEGAAMMMARPHVGGDGTGIKALRVNGNGKRMPWLNNQGWHLSYFGGPHALVRKIEAYSDADDLGVKGSERVKLLDRLITSATDIHSHFSLVRENRWKEEGAETLEVLGYPYDAPDYLDANPNMFGVGAGNNSDVPGTDNRALYALSRLDWTSALDRNTASCTRGPEIETSPPDMFGLTAIECATHGSSSITVLRSSGRCDAPPRPWPPAGTCGLSHLMGHTSSTAGVDGGVGGGGGVGQIQRLRPVLIAFASWPPPGDMGLEECSEQCAVSPNSDCAMEGDADLVIWGQTPKNGGDEAGASLPPRGHVKPDRQVWGVIGRGEASSQMHPMFDMAINGEIGQNSDFAGYAEGGICSICMRARELVMGYCSGEGGEEEEKDEEAQRNFQEAHTIIMMPQQGHNYRGAQLDHIIVRSSGVLFAGEREGGGIRVEIAGPGGYSQVVILDWLNPHNVWEISSDPRVFEHVLPLYHGLSEEDKAHLGLEVGLWEVHVSLYGPNRRILSTDHVFFNQV